jgi:hypothetical protein
MVAKTKIKGEKLGARRLKVDKLKLQKETVKELTGREQKGIKGGVMARTNFCGGNSTV